MRTKGIRCDDLEAQNPQRRGEDGALDLWVWWYVFFFFPPILDSFESWAEVGQELAHVER